MKEYDVLKYVIAVLALLVAIIAGLLILFKFQEKWIDLRSYHHQQHRYKTLLLIGDQQLEKRHFLLSCWRGRQR